jgi:ATP-binding cassette subfamily B protein
MKNAGRKNENKDEIKSEIKNERKNERKNESKSESKSERKKRGPAVKDMGGTTKRLTAYIVKNYPIRSFLVIVCIVITSLAGVRGSLFLRDLIDAYVVPLLEAENPDFTPLLRALTQMAIIYAVGVTSSYIFNRIMVTVCQGTLKKIRDDMFSHMQTLPLSFFDRRTRGDVMSYYTNDTDALRQMIVMSLPQLFEASVTCAASLVAMILANVYMTAFIMAVVVIILWIARFIGARSARGFMQLQRTLAEVNGYAEEILNGQKVVKVFNREEKVMQEFDEANDRLCDQTISANKYANILMPTIGNFSHLLYVLIAIIGGTLAVNNAAGVTLGLVASFLQLSRTLTMPMGRVSQQINSVARALAGAERIFELLDEKPETDCGDVTLVNAEQTDAGAIKESPGYTGVWAWKFPDGGYKLLEGDVRLDEVDFGYTKEPVLKNISLFAKPGQKIAFVGHTGAGKTTIANLINRFYDIDDGKIKYDGININTIKKPDLRKSLGIVLQDVNLFTGTVMENIRYGRLDATDEEVVEAAKLACAHGFISRLPQAYETLLVENGASLSQGQRQLISIARAAVANPPVMILDEATSSIDTRTEALVQKGMDKLMQGRTVFVIAHRLSTARNSKAILVLERGEIIERGDHQSLIEERGKYYQLYTGAFELE